MYYRIFDPSSAYEDSGNLRVYPVLPEGVDLGMGCYIDEPLDEPLRFEMDDEWGKDPKLMWGVVVFTMRQDVVQVLRNAGVDNLQTFKAVIKNPYTGEDMTDYLAVNILGLVAAADLGKSDYVAFSDPPSIDSVITKVKIDPDKAYGALMFRMAESVSEIIVHEQVKTALEKEFGNFRFVPT